VPVRFQVGGSRLRRVLTAPDPQPKMRPFFDLRAAHPAGHAVTRRGGSTGPGEVTVMRDRVVLGLAVVALGVLCWWCLARHAPVIQRKIAAGHAAAPAALPPPSLSATVASGKLVLAGRLPDTVTRTVLVGRAHDLFGPAFVVDRTTIGPVAKPGWLSSLGELVALLKGHVNGGVSLDGRVATLTGQFQSLEEQRGFSSAVAAALKGDWRINDLTFLSSSPPLSEQALAVQTTIVRELAGKVVEFESASDVITPAGKAVLDQVVAIVSGSAYRFEISGHTDSQGNRSANYALSRRRSEAVKAYLQSRGIPAGRMEALGYGDSRPVADNDTPEGRQRNRRIEFGILEGR